MRGRKKGSGVRSGTRPERETWIDIRNRYIYGSAEWRMVRLRQLIGDGSRLPDNHLSARTANRLARRDETAFLWDELRAQFERAVLDDNAEWFARQAKAIANCRPPHRLPERPQFKAEVVRLLEFAMWHTHAKQRAAMDMDYLTPAGKFTDETASDIYDALKKRELPNGRLLVEDWNCESKERVMEEIHDIAKTLRFRLRKQH